MRIRIENRSSFPEAAYAVKELTYFLEEYSNCVIDSCAAQQDDAYEVVFEKLEYESSAWQIWGNGRRMAVRGTDFSSLLFGMYRMLEMAGLHFSVNGVSIQAGRRWDIRPVFAYQGKVGTFLCRYRGIRQHINFPMDISSYHLEQAQEYIHNLVRMGYNHITFHSYTGQWHGYRTDKLTVLAGNFFYGQLYRLPGREQYHRFIHNEKIFCIPEVEHVARQEEERDRFARKWLGSLMKTAKEAGMHIVLSVELVPEESTQVHLQIADNVLRDYPLIDGLELISPEGGGGGEEFARAELEARLREYFGEKALVPGDRFPDKLPQALFGALESITRAVRLYERKEEIVGLAGKEIYVGLYVMCRDTLKLVKRIMTRIFAEDVLFTFLPAHGAAAVAENVEYMDFTPEELNRTMLYSWLEFDGNMYLQQNSSGGIDALLGYLDRKCCGKQACGVSFNHWRTQENELSASYASRCCAKYQTSLSYYEEFADAFGIGKKHCRQARFVNAMELLEKTDTFIRNRLFNIGFCYLGCWLMFPGLGWIRNWQPKDMDYAIGNFQRIKENLEEVLACTDRPEGIRRLRFLNNRLQCSIYQLLCVKELSGICEYARDDAPEALTGKERQAVLDSCSRADRFADSYMEEHLKCLPDRGCQGTAVSYYETMPVYIDHIRQYFVYGEKECCHYPTTFDCPPPPDTNYL